MGARGPAAGFGPGRGPIRVAIVENHELVAQSLDALIDGEPDMEVVARARSVGEAVAIPRSAEPDVILMDFHLDDGTGHDAALAMRPLHPRARFVFLSRDSSDAAQLAAIEAGASAYLSKSCAAADVVEAVRRVAEGESMITPSTVASMLARGRVRELKKESLSARELEVLQLMSDGVPTREIGQRLGVSYSTVRTHVRSINAKLGARSMLNAVVAARELELIH